MGKSRHKQSTGCGLHGSGPPALLTSPCWSSTTSFPLPPLCHVGSTRSCPQQPRLGRVDELEYADIQPHSRSKKQERFWSRGRIKLQLQGRGEQAVVSASVEQEEIDGSDAEPPMVLQAASGATRCRVARPREERCTRRRGWLTDWPTHAHLGIDGTALEQESLTEIHQLPYLPGVGPPDESEQLLSQPPHGRWWQEIYGSLAGPKSLSCPNG